ncbi:tyrosine-type recombinase/integrase [Undibacterium sp.]|uniref:phage integrase n=1 Tax=Undibacterium sp. TaxID=1914977 RepID=UPI00272EFAF1|nr:tyrosine-type recombinase/integrase [Undibacterium sp.]MDP1979240.1 tyrosine-type recombinase/integrase [Undibacterium sp.]
MRPKKSARDLPPRMLMRVRPTKGGKDWVGYYYNARTEDGKRKEIPLGRDLNEAKRKWAELECVTAPLDTSLMSHVFDRYIRHILPGKARSTQKDNMDSIKQLRSVFDTAPIDAITPQMIAMYRDTRSAKIRANRELALLSHIFNTAREWGYTSRENPCRGVRKNKEEPRDFYASKKIWDAVYSLACDELKDAMDLAYLTGQRPGDVLKMKVADIQDGALLVKQGKTKKFLRIVLEQDGIRSELGKVLDRILSRPHRINKSNIITTMQDQPLNKWTLRLRFERARSAAAENARFAGDEDMASTIMQFQFRDIRPKAASEISDLHDASKLLGHSDKQITETVYRRIGESVKPTR